MQKGAFDIGEVLSESWAEFSRNLAPYVVAGIAATLVSMLTCGLGGLLVAHFAAGVGVAALRSLRAGGAQIEVGAVFEPLRTHLGPLLVLGIIEGLGIAIGSMLCVLPGIYLMIAWMLAPFYVVDRGTGAVDALKASMQAVHANLGGAVLLGVALGLLNAVASSVAIGLVVSLPFSWLALAVAYRRLVDASA